MGHRVGDDLADHERCLHIKASGSRCAQPRLGVDAKWGASTAAEEIAGRRLCRWHEDMLTQRMELWRRAEDAPTLSVEQHLEMQLKMAYVMVRELEFQVLDLGLALDAWRIDTEETEERSSEDPKNSYVSSKRAKLHGAHPVIIQYLREREHYGTIIKTCIGAGIATKQLAIIERYVESLLTGMLNLMTKAGHDPNDPTVRQLVMETIREQQQALQDLAPADARAIEG